MIFFSYDLGKKFGLGHASRCLAINQKLIKKKIKTYYLNLNTKKKITIKNFGQKIIYKKDLRKLNGLRNVLIVDSYNIDQKRINFYNRYFKFIFLINDLPVKNLSVYAIINPNYGIKKKDYNQKKIENLFLGIDYKFIREIKLSASKNKSGITISFGAGSVYYRVRKYLLNTLKFLSNINFKEEIHIFINIQNQQKKEILRYSKLKVKIYDISNHFIKTANQSRFVISSLGTQYDELCKLKIPSIFIKISKNQRSNYNISRKINAKFTHELKNFNEKIIEKSLNEIMKKQKRDQIIKNYNKYPVGKKTDYLVNYLNNLIYN